MQVPRYLDDLIRRDLRVSAAVSSALAAVDPFIRNSQLPFFPEYTDHGPRHNEEVLETAVDLMHEDARALTTPQDAAVLVLATLLHDCGMHLTEDGFVTLIQRGSIWKGNLEFGDNEWYRLWEDFIAEARRFDGRKLTSLFGDSEPVQRPPQDPNRFTRRDRLLIGEFLRRHHARLAHDIAAKGIPGVTSTPAQVLTNLNQDFVDLIGLVARSHGTSLRVCTDYLNKNYHLRDFQGVHAIFLMVLLRIADYLQIQAKRAPSEVLETRRLRSPISQGEWKLHDSIRNVTSASADPEAIYVDARPPDVKTYLLVRHWLDGIQGELDTSWAVLGEAYGRFSDEGLDRLKLKMRRVRSNLDDADDFSRTVSYVPARVAFDAFNPDLLKLLVRPLYGDRPEFGIRELLQNAVDAVNERRVYLDKFSSSCYSGSPNIPEVEIIIHLDGSEPQWLIVKDQGIGMTLDVLMNYFLKAGASFRSSDMWKMAFEDDTGCSKVLRSGRFGIGVLAAFILGKKIEVTTRHVSEPMDRALRFSAGLDSDQIEIRYTSSEVGTTIKIKIDKNERDRVRKMMEDKFGEDSWDFYCLRDPQVVRRLAPTNQLKRQRRTFDDSQWIATNVEGYDAMYWTYRNFNFLTCNGICVMRSANPMWKLNVGNMGAYSLKHPNVFVMDSNGNLPLNLQRTSLTIDKLPFGDTLTRSVLDQLGEWMKENRPEDPIWEAHAVGRYFEMFPGLAVQGEFRWSHWAMLEDGAMVVDRGLFARRGVAKVLMVPESMIERKGTKLAEFTRMDEVGGSAVVSVRLGGGSFTDKLEELKPFLGGRYGRSMEGMRPSGQRILLRQEFVKWILGRRQVLDYVASALDAKNREYENEQWAVFKLGNCAEEPFFRFREFAASAMNEEDPEEGNLLAEWYIRPRPGSESEVSKAWLAAYDEVCPSRTEGETRSLAP